MSFYQSQKIHEVRQDAIIDLQKFQRQFPVEGVAWDMAGQIAKRNGWDWCTSSVSGKEWALMVIMLDKLTARERS